MSRTAACWREELTSLTHACMQDSHSTLKTQWPTPTPRPALLLLSLELEG